MSLEARSYLLSQDSSSLQSSCHNSECGLHLSGARGTDPVFFRCGANIPSLASAIEERRAWHTLRLLLWQQIGAVTGFEAEAGARSEDGGGRALSPGGVRFVRRFFDCAGQTQRTQEDPAEGGWATGSRPVREGQTVR